MLLKTFYSNDIPYYLYYELEYYGTMETGTPNKSIRTRDKAKMIMGLKNS